MDLKELGLSKEELAERVACAAVDRFVEMDGELSRMIQERLDAKVSEIAEAAVLPRVNELVEGITLQATNRWGEARGEKLSFTEYLVAQAEAYLREEVDYQGKAKGDGHSSFWRAKQTRIAHMVHEHLHYSIERAMKDALKTVNEALADGLQKTVEMKLAEIVKSVNVSVSR